MKLTTYALFLSLLAFVYSQTCDLPPSKFVDAGSLSGNLDNNDQNPFPLGCAPRFQNLEPTEGLTMEIYSYPYAWQLLNVVTQTTITGTNIVMTLNIQAIVSTWNTQTLISQEN